LEYFVGAAITLGVVYFVNKYINNNIKPQSLPAIEYSQSHIYELMRPLLPHLPPPSIGTTQAINYLSRTYMKIMIVKDRAYWIKDNTFYVATVVDGQVNKETAKEVDTMAMSKVELDEMMFIVEKLREDNNDSRGSGKS
jgi:hypothetical protein